MKTQPVAKRHRSRPAGAVLDLDAARIERALARRARYRYVQPRVLAQGAGQGWVILSPNCSRNVDPEGGEIPIAWFEPCKASPAQWRLHWRDQAQACWVVRADAVTLDQALAQVCGDPLGVWWP